MRVLLGVEAPEVLGELGDRRAGRLEGGQRRPGRALGRRHRRDLRLEPALEPRHRLPGRLAALEVALDAAEPRLERGEARDHGSERGVLLGVQLGQLLHERRLRVGALRRGAAGGEARLQRRGGRGLGAFQCVEAGGEPLEEPARLGGAAHLLEGLHPGAQLVQAGERGLERRVLVADEPEELGGHRLQPVLGGAGTVELRREPGLHRLDRRHAALDAAGHGFEAGLEAGLGTRVRRRAGPARLPPLPRGEARGHEEEAEAGEREHDRCDGVHGPGSAPGFAIQGPSVRPKWLERR